MLARAGLLRWHTVEGRSTPGYFVFGMPHTSAVLKNQLTGKKWVVDSKFHDNGIAPEIVPLRQWRWGWKPDSLFPSLGR